MSSPMSNATQLELIRAGAGSGKTYNLCETVAAAVADGLDPARIMATTFTTKAAAELKGRIQSKLLAGSDDPVKNQMNADRLELAAIGTVHSVAHRVLSRYAVELGLSTRLEVMPEESGERLVASQLNILPMDGWRQLVDCAGRLGIHDLQQQLLKILDEKRGNQISDDDFRQQLKASASRVCQLLSPLSHLISADHDELLTHIREALATIAGLNDSTGVTKKGRDKLLDLQSQRISKWGIYAEASRVKAGTRSGADAALANLRNHAAEVCNHQALHDDVCLFCNLLADHAILIETECRDYKVQRGLVDFTDLETLFLDALSGDQLPALVEKDFSLVMVDEFQDTNPLQLAIFQAIRRIAPRHRWVGDPKQAIFGFRGTDPDLVSRVWQQFNESELPPLPDNRRSQKGLVQFVGKVFEPIFGDDAKQNPVNERSDRNVERWLLNASNQTGDAEALVAGIRQLQDEGHRLGDIVVLERSNAGVQRLAEQLERSGVDYLFETAGLLSTREGVLTIAGMRLVLDRNDSLAAATIKHFLSSPDDATPGWIIDRLTQRVADRQADASDGNRVWQQPWQDDADLLALERIDRKTSSPHSVCELVMEALQLPCRIASWGNVAQRASNLDSMLKHVAGYEEQMLGAGQAATLGGAILHLEQLAADDKDIKYPPLGHNAVTIMTYHKSKGLQWPVVILTGLNSDRGPNMWQPLVGGGGDDATNPLAGRTIRAWSWPFGMSDSRPPKRRTGTTLDDDAVASPEGVEQAADEIAENMRLLYVGCTRAESKLVFAHRRGTDRWLQRLPDIDSVLPIDGAPGEHSIDGIDTTYVLRHLDPPESDEVILDQATLWFATDELDGAAASQQRFHSPSQVESDPSDQRPFSLTQLAGGSHFPESLPPDQYAAFGDAVHAYMAALPSLSEVDETWKTTIAERCLSAHSMDGKLAASVLVAIGDRFVDWVSQTYPGATWRVEIPASTARQAGGDWNGTLDLLLELPDGRVVVVDHKSAPIRRTTCETQARQYAAQLDAYDEMLAALGRTVVSRWIHFPLAGVVAELQSPIA
ncbi:UvrD-helicase domain-containing protein [Rosistilla oblonga]|uniref:UvrD-helicase domain-containing protein n=1 Tax=Rosistilla oblonga TaxID=2527990 RepID=UPI003A97EC83